MSSILIKNVVLNGTESDVLIEGKLFTRIEKNIPVQADTVIDCQGKQAILPPFYNLHTHAAMTLFRGYADDYELFKWLTEYIWPAESRLTAKDVYAGTRLGCLEMIRSGCVAFSDMYWFQSAVIRAAEEMGLRTAVGIMRLTNQTPETLKQLNNDEIFERRNDYSDLVTINYAPHAIYTVSEKELREIAENAKQYGMGVQIHLAETQKEFDDCREQHNGMTPAEYLDSLGMLGPRTVCAHAVYLTDSDMELMAERKSVLVNNPVSNMKLASGIFRYKKALECSCRIALGTDGASSNNNLSMLEEMKAAALLAKVSEKDPELMPAKEIFRIATKCGAEAMNVDAGIIEKGKIADCILVDLENPLLVPQHELVSNVVYSADSSCISSVICNGRLLMRDHEVPGEQEIIAEARAAAKRVCKL